MANPDIDGSTATIWIVKKPGLGWVAWDYHSRTVMGRPWNIQFGEQGDHPPAGDWVSKKGPKSYLYELVYVSSDIGETHRG